MESKRREIAKRAKAEIELLRSYIASDERVAKVETQADVVAWKLAEVTDLPARLTNPDEADPAFDSSFTR